MREALFIFRKDVRHFRMQLAAFLTLLGLLAWAEVRTPRQPAWATPGLICQWMLAPAAWYLIVLAIHEERLPGDRQYWLTRPYPRGSLLLAKALFAAAFLNLPLLLIQIVALAVNGLSPAEYGRALAARQFFFTALMVLPAAALATVTASLAQFAIGVFAVFGVVLAIELGGGHPPRGGSDGMAWIESSAVAALALALFGVVVWMQYRQRRTMVAAGVVAAGVAACALVPALDLWSAQFALQRRLGGQSTVQLRFDEARDPAEGGRPGQPDPDLVALAIPAQWSGVPPGMAVLRERTAITIEAGGGLRWRSGWWPAPLAEHGVLHGNGPAWQYLAADREFFETVKNEPVHLLVRAAFTLFDAPAETRVPVPAQGRWVADVGFCWTSAARFTCFAPFAHAAWVDAEGHPPPPAAAEPIMLRPEMSYAPYPTGAGFGLWTTDLDEFWPYEKHWTEIAIRTRRAVAHFERDLDIPEIRLARYAGGAP